MVLDRRIGFESFESSNNYSVKARNASMEFKFTEVGSLRLCYK